MGFGTLFIGYFLLLNLTYYGFTDLIAASVMLLGLYKLSNVNKYFSYSCIAAAVFLVFSLGEFGIASYEIFMRPIGSAVLVSVMSILRCISVGLLTVFILKGIENVAKEVDVENLPEKASKLIIITAVVYSAWIVLEAPLGFVNDYVLGVLSLITILATIALIIVNLSVIYTAYMRICMPGDENIDKEKPSRFAFVNEYRARKAERERETAEKRAALLRERAEKKKGKKK
jgi:hypothetical protein